MSTSIPDRQRAVQLVGPEELRLNEDKDVFAPGEHQILARVEAVGLCLSDVKLLRQFDGHARKSEVIGGIAPAELRTMPHYVPGSKPTVPGHETVVRVVRVGPEVEAHRVGDRFLVQTDYRWLATAGSNAAFGYNFEGALQEYVLLDERVITAPDGRSMLIPAPEELSASAIALCEPWACVEDAYAEKQRRTLEDGGRALVVHEAGTTPDVSRLPGRPEHLAVVAAGGVAELPDATFDDVVYFGADPETVEKLFPRVANHGLLLLVQCGETFGRDVVSQIGRIHYGGIRIAGTTGHDPAGALAAIPSMPEIRADDRVNVIGAAGPMGTMHVIRALCQGIPGVTVHAGDRNRERLAALRVVAEPLARENEVELHVYDPTAAAAGEDEFDYIVVLVPSPALIAAAIGQAAPHAIINIFAGVGADTTGALDLDTYIARGCYFVGTSGSVLEDMEAVLAKVAGRRLDTNLSVAAVCGLDGAVDGIRAVEHGALTGKVVVYPSCRGLELTPIAELDRELPLENGHWTKDAEDALLRRFGAS